MAESKDISFTSPPAAVQAQRQLEDARRFLDTGDASKAQEVCRDLLGAHPEYVEALATLGRAYLAEKNHDAALPCFLRASMLAADDPAILTDLADIYFHLGSHDMARQTAEHVLTLSPGKDAAYAAHLLIGRVCYHQNDYGAAIAHLEQVKSASQDTEDAAFLLGLCHLETGNRKEAIATLTVAMKSGLPALEHAEALYRLSHVSDAAQAKKLLKELDAFEEEAPSFASEEEEQRFAAFRDFARAALLGRAGNAEDAWELLESANSSMGGGFQEAQQQLREADEHIIQRASEWIYAGAPLDDISEQGPLSLFILGLPSSGKSTLERLVGAVDGVAKGFDHDLVQVAARETATSNGFLPLNFPGQLPTSAHRQFTKTYARATKARAQGAEVLTCTNSDLLADLGRIAETVQRMKVVFLTRDHDDTALRIFEQYFADGSNPYSYNVSAIYEQFEVYTRLSDAWAEALHGVCLRVSYEDLVSDPQATLKRVADFCALDASDTEIPDLGDDRGCAEPYRDKLDRARSGAIAPLSGWAMPEL